MVMCQALLAFAVTESTLGSLRESGVEFVVVMRDGSCAGCQTGPSLVSIQSAPEIPRPELRIPKVADAVSGPRLKSRDRVKRLPASATTSHFVGDEHGGRPEQTREIQGELARFGRDLTAESLSVTVNGRRAYAVEFQRISNLLALMHWLASRKVFDEAPLALKLLVARLIETLSGTQVLLSTGFPSSAANVVARCLRHLRT